MNDTLEDTTFLEELLDVPHCEHRHDIPGVHRWAGDCSHEVVARFTFCLYSRLVCQNVVDGFMKIPRDRICKACKNPVGECWSIDPL